MPFGEDVPGTEEVPASGTGATVVNLDDDPFVPADLREPLGRDEGMEEVEDYEGLLAQAPDDDDEGNGEPIITSDVLPDKSTEAAKSATGTRARKPAAGKTKTPASTQTATVATGRKRKAASAPAPPAPKRGRPARAAGSVAKEAITDGAAKKAAAKGGPATTGAKRRRGRPKGAANGTAKEEAGEEWEVEEVLDDMIEESFTHVFLVKWKGYPASENTWEPRGNLEGCASLVKDYETKKKQATKSRRIRKPKS